MKIFNNFQKTCFLRALRAKYHFLTHFTSWFQKLHFFSDSKNKMKTPSPPVGTKLFEHKDYVALMVNFKQVSHIGLVFSLFTLYNKIAARNVLALERLAIN